MPQNLEIKASFPSVAEARRIAVGFGARWEGTLLQTDTYFLTGSERLKLREIKDDHSELIFYRRPDERKSRFSDYTVVRVDDPTALKALFSKLFGTRVVVVKRRELFIYKNARVHVDSVRKIGTFVEFEVLVLHGRNQAQSLMNFLLKQFCIRKAALIGGSYSDLIMSVRRRGTNRVSWRRKKNEIRA